MKLFHGTTADALPLILKNGLTTEAGGGNWTVSGEAVYFWSPEALIEAGEAEEESDGEFQAAQRAVESGEFGLGFSKDCRVVLLEVELDTEVFDVQPDESCEHMTGAVCVFDDVPASAIKSIKISDDLSLIRGYYLAMHLNRDMSSRRYDMTAMQEKVAKLFADDCSIFDELDDLRDMREYVLPV